MYNIALFVPEDLQMIHANDIVCYCRGIPVDADFFSASVSSDYVNSKTVVPHLQTLLATGKN